MTVRIAMWSGPRNLSTAMMYAFAARGDCAVSDEPFYAAYLALTGLEHPMRAEIMASQPQDPLKVVLTGDAPGAAPIWYQKHMTHHMVPGIPLEWMSQCRHAFLIRHPARVVASYVRKRESPVLEDLGYTQQLALFDRMAQATGEAPPVLDSTALRAAPRDKLRALCAALQIPWTERMLYWAKGRKSFDGVWASHWYHAVHQSSGFDAAAGPVPELPPEYARLADSALPTYEALARYAL